jgi:hypothetical protein
MELNKVVGTSRNRVRVFHRPDTISYTKECATLTPSDGCMDIVTSSIPSVPTIQRCPNPSFYDSQRGVNKLLVLQRLYRFQPGPS